MLNDEFAGGNYNKDKARILSASSMSKKSTGASYLTFNAKKSDEGGKRGGKDARGSKYLTLDTKKALNFLRHPFTQASIFYHFDLERQIYIGTDA